MDGEHKPLPHPLLAPLRERGFRALLVLSALAWVGVLVLGVASLALRWSAMSAAEAGLLTGLVGLGLSGLAVRLLVFRSLSRKLQRAAAELQEAHAEVERQAKVDALTGAFTHGEGFALLDREVKRAQRYRRPLSVLFIDIDNLKVINDSFGHLVGDAVLRALGSLLAHHLRALDLPFRYGGDEFVVILPETALPEAASAAQRLADRASDEAKKAGLPPGVPLKFSVGVASLPQTEVTAETLVAAADKSLYSAKARGGGVAQGVEPPQPGT